MDISRDIRIKSIQQFSSKITLDKVNKLNAETTQQTEEDLKNLLKRIEACVYKYVKTEKKNKAFYLYKCKSLLNNLDPDSYIKNSTLLQRVLKDQTLAEKLPAMTPEQLFPTNWEYEQTKLKKQTEYEKTGITGTTNEFKCDKCHARSTTYYYMQLRSADEPMTCCITCTKCHHQWKQ